MKLKIVSEKYGITPAPVITNDMMTYFWSKFDLIARNNEIDWPIESIHIRVNQALPWTDYHFYVTINNDIETNEHTYHMQFGKYEIAKYAKEKLDRNHIMFVDYQKGYNSKKWHFLQNVMQYSMKELNSLFKLQ